MMSICASGGRLSSKLMQSSSVLRASPLSQELIAHCITSCAKGQTEKMEQQQERQQQQQQQQQQRQQQQRNET